MAIRAVLTGRNRSCGDVVARAETGHFGDSAMCSLGSVGTIVATIAARGCVQLVYHSARSEGNDAGAVVESVASIAA